MKVLEHSADQAGLELADTPACDSQELGLKMCPTTNWLKLILNTNFTFDISHCKFLEGHGSPL